MAPHHILQRVSELLLISFSCLGVFASLCSCALLTLHQRIFQRSRQPGKPRDTPPCLCICQPSRPAAPSFPHPTFRSPPHRLAPQACPTSYYVHFNNYIRLASNVSQWVDDSSTHRLARATAMGVPA